MFKQSAQHIGTYYAATYGQIPLRPRLQEALDCDVIIVGGGFSGLHTGLRRLGHHDLAGTTGAATTTVAATSASTTHVTPPRIRLAVGDATHLAGPG